MTFVCTKCGLKLSGDHVQKIAADSFQSEGEDVVKFKFVRSQLDSSNATVLLTIQLQCSKCNLPMMANYVIAQRKANAEYEAKLAKDREDKKKAGSAGKVLEGAVAERMDQEKAIFVNGREKKVQWDSIAYRGAVELAFPDERDDQPGYNKLFTVTWSLKDGNVGGSLTKGQHTKVVEGMRIDVVDTSQA